MIHALLPGIVGELNQTMKKISIGDKFKLLGEVWIVDQVNDWRIEGTDYGIFHAFIPNPKNVHLGDMNYSISKADALDWVEEKPKMTMKRPCVKHDAVCLVYHGKDQCHCWDNNPCTCYEEEKPRPIEDAFMAGQASKLSVVKSEIIREVLLIIAAAWEDCIKQDRKEHLWDALRRRAKEME